MENQPAKKSKKVWWVVGGIALAVTIIGIASDNSNTQILVPATQTANISQQVAPPTTPAPSSQTQLSNDNYYTNSDGNSIHSPAYSNTVPAGASAQCRDGSYSFSKHRSGTCSGGHGGVATWY